MTKWVSPSSIIYAKVECHLGNRNVRKYKTHTLLSFLVVPE